MAVFARERFLLIDAPHSPVSCETERLIVSHGGTVFREPPAAPASTITRLEIDHIISETYDFAAYAEAVERFVPVTTPAWVSASVGLQQRKNYRLFSPRPAPFMDKVVVCIADNLAQGDKEMMYAGVRAFGGQYLDALSRYTTHLVAVDLTNNKSVVACNIKKLEGMEIKIVLPQWVDHCLAHQRHVDEAPFLLSDPSVLQTGKPNFAAAPPAPSESSDLLAGKRVFVCSDHHLSEHLESSVASLVESCGGTVVADFDPRNIDVFLGKWRAGPQYRACVAADPAVAVASLHWLFHVVKMKRYVDPLHSSLLHYPVPQTPVARFQNLRISITGVNGDARHHLCSLILAMGATFTKTLDSNNDVLVTHHTNNEKYAAAKSRWPAIKTVNTSWLEECFAKWDFLDPADPRYSSEFDPLPSIGQVRLSRNDLKRWAQDGENTPVVDDSAEEHPSSEEPFEQMSGEKHSPKQKTTSEIEGSVEKSSLFGGKDSSPEQESEVSKNSPREYFSGREHTGTPSASATPVPNAQEVEVIKVENTLTENVAGRSARSAKQKASAKLHSDMDDLNQYTSMSKSSRKMKDYMRQLEKSIAPKSQKTPTEEARPPSDSPAPKRKKQEKKVHLVAVMTGCEQDLVVTKSDLLKLAHVGIVILSDYNPRKKIDTIIAPRVLRTEKFLKSLSKATRIIHPSYLSDILSRLATSELSWDDLTTEFKISDYSLDRVVSVKQINEDLGVSGKVNGLQQLLGNKAPVFEDVQLNLSTNLNGGADLIASILKEHGLKYSKTLKLSSATKKSALLQSNGDIILVAHKSKDKKAVAALEGVTAVDWDWCVKSIFHGQLQNHHAYSIT